MVTSMRYNLLFSVLFLTNVALANASQETFNQDGDASRYEAALNELNEFLKDFDDGYYGYIEVVDDFIVIRFQEGKYSKFKIKDMAMPEWNDTYGQVTWDCKNSSNCVLTDWNDEGVESGILFQSFSDLDYLMELLSNFISAYQSK